VALTDTFVKQVRWGSANTAGDKHADGNGMHLLVKASGKYWRFDYRHLGKQKTLALGVYPEVSLLKARKRRTEARELLADGQDPGAAKQDKKAAQRSDAANTFKTVALDWLDKTKAERAPTTQVKVSTWLEKDVIPHIGKMPMRSIRSIDVLEKVVRRMEARGAIDTAHRVKQMCGQVFRFAVVTGSAERDVTADLKGALEKKKTVSHAALTEPKAVGALMRAIYAYTGHHATVTALKLAPLVFARPGELRTAEWAEIDLDAAEWRIPSTKMKMGKEHIVPLSTQAVELLRGIQPLTGAGQQSTELKLPVCKPERDGACVLTVF
jgi:integrase